VIRCICRTASTRSIAQPVRRSWSHSLNIRTKCRKGRPRTFVRIGGAGTCARCRARLGAGWAVAKRRFSGCWARIIGPIYNALNCCCNNDRHKCPKKARTTRERSPTLPAFAKSFFAPLKCVLRYPDPGRVHVLSGRAASRDCERAPSFSGPPPKKPAAGRACRGLCPRTQATE
jgi:hypothetical protein